MSNPGDADATPISSVRQMAEHIAAGCKPPDAYRIGTEHEKFGFRLGDRQPPPYEPGGIRALLDGLAGPGWSPILDRGNVIGLKGEGLNEGASVALEPGGQFELSGGLLRTLHETRDELAAHFSAVREVAAPLGLGFAPLGFHPTATRAEMPVMPKSRYAIMRRYMQLTGTLGLDMMLRTCTVQVNLDYSSEADMARKLRVSLALQPVATALFANSPFTEGRPNGFLSARAQVWTDTDPDRTGMPATMFEGGFGFERFVEWVLDVPMYFVMRGGAYVDVAGASFRDHVAGKLRDAAGDPVPGRATLGDFADHVTTVFTDVRLKRFLEMRGADAGSPAMMLAQSAFWVGLLYDDAALTAAEALVRRRPWTEYSALRAAVPRQGLSAPLSTLPAGGTGGVLRDLARDAVAIAADGLRARARRDSAGQDETGYLDPLRDIVAGAPTQAEHWLSCYHGAWAGQASRILDAAAV